MTQVTRKGRFVLPNGFTSALVDVHVTETIRKPDEPGVDDLTGWANLPPESVPRVTAHWIETDGEAELRFDNGSIMAISISSTSTIETGWALVRFYKRTE